MSKNKISPYTGPVLKPAKKCLPEIKKMEAKQKELLMKEDKGTPYLIESKRNS